MNPANEFERNIWIDNRDGLADIFLAFLLLAFGLGIHFDMAWLGAIMAAVLYPIWQSAKSRITLPRLRQAGRLEENGGRARQIYRGMVILFCGAFLLGIIFFALFAIGNFAEGMRSWLNSNFELAFGLFWAVFLASAGAILRASRFFAYAILAVIIFPVGGFVALPLWITITTFGFLILLAGLFVLMQFILQKAV